MNSSKSMIQGKALDRMRPAIAVRSSEMPHKSVVRSEAIESK